MNIGRFHRQRRRIEQRFPAGSKRRQAMAHLVREARAAMVVVSGHAVGWRLPGGAMSCTKRRYPNATAAYSDLDRIASTSAAGRVPVRAYPCEFCGGWHTTAQGRKRVFIHSKDVSMRNHGP